MQALGDAERQSYMKGKRILEVNPRHPLIKQVKAKFEAEPENTSNAALAKILYETALLESGFQVGSNLDLSMVYSQDRVSLHLVSCTILATACDCMSFVKVHLARRVYVAAQCPVLMSMHRSGLRAYGGSGIALHEDSS